jgi:hypothetical protein
MEPIGYGKPRAHAGGLNLIAFWTFTKELTASGVPLLNWLLKNLG